MNTPEPQSAEREGSFANMIEVSKELHIVPDGPLSQMFTATLNALYAKEVDPETGIAIESQALDAQNSQTLWMANKIATHREDVGMLYGVLAADTSIKDVMRVADAITDMTEPEKANSAIIIQDNGATFPVKSLYRGADALDEQNSPMVDALARQAQTLVTTDADKFPVEQAIAAQKDPSAAEPHIEPTPDAAVVKTEAPVVMPHVVTSERDASSGKLFQNYHYADVLSRNTSALYSNDNDFSTRMYRANNTFARALQVVAETHGIPVFPSLEAYLESKKPKG